MPDGSSLDTLLHLERNGRVLAIGNSDGIGDDVVKIVIDVSQHAHVHIRIRNLPPRNRRE